jgi:hypothetical protein
MLCRLLKVNRCFGGTYCLHLQGQITWARNQCESRLHDIIPQKMVLFITIGVRTSKPTYQILFSTCWWGILAYLQRTFLPKGCLNWFIEQMGFIYQTIQHHTTGDQNLNTHCFGNLKSHKKKQNSMVWVRERTIPTKRRRLSAKWLPTFADKGCHMVSVTDPYGRILDFLDRSRYFSIK